MCSSLPPSASAWAQSDEIQVYTGELETPGKANLTIHANYTPRGDTMAPFPGGTATQGSVNGAFEWAYGVSSWFEAGTYLPVYSLTRDHKLQLDGVKLRLLFAVPRADDRTFFYGVNFEFSDNARHWDPKRFTSEIRPIIGWHLHPVDIIVNPIFDTAYDGLENLEFAPATRVACDLSRTWKLAIEEYDDFGPLHQFYAGNQQPHQLYGVVDHATKGLKIEAGVGFGLTDASDRITLKLILSRDLN